MIDEETIVALSTPPGISAIGVIRLTGIDAIVITDRCFRGKTLAGQSSHTLHFGHIIDGTEIVDEAVIGLFKSPHSYTKEDIVEISCHGSPLIQQKIIQLLIKNGARAAKAGEFTMRAFLNGRLDLSQAEAVADLIAADSESARRAAISQMRGGFSNEIKKLREELIHFAAMIELELDFSEEDVEFANREELKTLVLNLESKTSDLRSSFQLGNVIKNGVTAVIAGRPNAGKSTLLNSLLNEDRAIVSEIPGTTRDTIEEVITIDSILFRLIDTAGIREATDVIEKIGVERTLEKIRQSALVLYLFDVKDMNREDLLYDLSRLPTEGIPVIAAGNKSDNENVSVLHEKFHGIPNLLFISAKEQVHLDVLKQKMISLTVDTEYFGDRTIVTNVRHYDALLQTGDALHDILAAMDMDISKELLASDIRRALNYLGEITGEITNDEILSDIFSKFCIGK